MCAGKRDGRALSRLRNVHVGWEGKGGLLSTDLCQAESVLMWDTVVLGIPGGRAICVAFLSEGSSHQSVDFTLSFRVRKSRLKEQHEHECVRLNSTCTGVDRGSEHVPQMARHDGRQGLRSLVPTALFPCLPHRSHVSLVSHLFSLTGESQGTLFESTKK